MKLNKIIIALLLLSANVNGQVNNDFNVLKSAGSLPADFNVPSSQKVEEQYEKIPKSMSSAETKSEKKFILESNYFIDQVLSNGLVLYGSELNRYIDKVADELLKNDKELRSKLNFYVIKSPTVNAFSTDRGAIFITVGLLAQIENEAQLAFILTHEFVHYIKRHAKNGFLENKRIEHEKGKFSQINWNKALSKSKYSKKMEIEADVEGLEIFLKSNYSLDEISSTLDVLQYAHLPFDDVLFEKQFFNDEYLTLPSSVLDREVAEITEIDDEDDKYQDHPNINKRRAIMTDEIEGKSNKGRVDFIVSEKDFLKSQSLARFELSFLYVKNRNYGEAIYNNYLLLKSNPDSKFLKISIGYSLYALAKYKNDSKIHEVLSDYKDVQGESQNVFYLFDEMKKEAYNVLAVKYLWELKEKYPDDKFLAIIAKDAIKEMLLESGVRKSDFSKTFLVTDKKEKNDSTVLTKYDKIKSKKKSTGNLFEYAFIKLLKNKEFSSLMKKYEREYVDKIKSGNDYNNEFETGTKNEKRALGIDKMVMVAPNYRHFETRRKVAEKYVYSEEKKEYFTNLNKSIAKNKKVDLKVISNSLFISTEEYNNMSLLNGWLGERYNHLNLNIYPYCGIYSDELIADYGTNYFAWTGIYSFKVKRRGLGWTFAGAYGLGALGGTISFIAMGVLAPIPFLIYTLKSTKHSFYYTYLFDISNYDALLVNEDFKKSTPTTLYITDSFNQISSKKRQVQTTSSEDEDSEW